MLFIINSIYTFSGIHYMDVYLEHSFATFGSKYEYEEPRNRKLISTKISMSDRNCLYNKLN